MHLSERSRRMVAVAEAVQTNPGTARHSLRGLRLPEVIDQEAVQSSVKRLS
jgi:hypothetical protein